MDEFPVPLGAAIAECIRVVLDPRATWVRQIVCGQQLVAQRDGFVEVAGLGPAACSAEVVNERFLAQLLVRRDFAQPLFDRRGLREFRGRCFRLLPLAQESPFEDQPRENLRPNRTAGCPETTIYSWE